MNINHLIIDKVEAGFAHHNDAHAIMLDEDQHRRKKNQIEGRFLDFSVADGKAYYLIDEVREKSVTLLHVPLFDGYTEPLIEDFDFVLPMKTVLRKLESRDKLNDLFQRK